MGRSALVAVVAALGLVSGCAAESFTMNFWQFVLDDAVGEDDVLTLLDLPAANGTDNYSVAAAQGQSGNRRLQQRGVRSRAHLGHVQQSVVSFVTLFIHLVG